MVCMTQNIGGHGGQVDADRCLRPLKCGHSGVVHLVHHNWG